MSEGPIGRARTALRALETLRRCDTTGGAPTAEELEQLRRWPGWGALAPALEPAAAGTWAEIGGQIAELLSRKDTQSGQHATYSSYYTPPEITAACWDLLRRLGFPGGRVLEPGCGAGAFMTAAPQDLEAGLEWVGIERDPVSARIAALLHPEAAIQTSTLEEAVLPDHSVDAVIGNVPFADVRVYAPTAPDAVTRNLHNYCVWRSVQALRPGGIAVLLTSRYTLDAKDPAARQAIHANAELITAIRLPNGTFATTDTCADILVLRRRTTPLTEDAGRPMWLAADDRYPGTGYQPLNQHFARAPMWMLGELRTATGPYGEPTLRVEPAPHTHRLPLSDVIDIAVDHATDRRMLWDVPPPPKPLSETLQPRPDGCKEGSFQLRGGDHVFQVIDGEMRRVARAGPELKALIKLRDAIVRLLEAETDHTRPDPELAPLRATLNHLYDRYTKKHGPLNRATMVQGSPDPETGLPAISRRRPRMGGFRTDPDYATVLALENYDDETGQAAKTPIFTQRVNRPAQRRTHADTPAEAIGLCLDQLGRLDLPTIAGLLGTTAEQAEARLQADDLAFTDPDTGTWVTADEYLSGNVRAKLTEARDAARTDPGRWQRNVAALQAVHPNDLTPEDIHARPGAPWIPASDIQAFIAETLGDRFAEVNHEAIAAEWEVKTRNARDTVAAISQWGTSRADAYLLLEQALNGRAATVWDATGDGRRVRNAAETMAAEEKQRALIVRFGEWVWEEPERADRLCAVYNRLFNSTVQRKYDGAHLSFPGLAEDFEPYTHQRDMVHRMISTPAALCPYPVGTGKTGTMFMAARKLKELGLCNKPLIVVPNHLLEQTTREGKRMFPAANILMATKHDLADDAARKRFAARCATGDWDTVVMTHSAFTMLPVHPRTQADHLEELCDRFSRALGTAGKQDGKPSRGIKRITKLIDGWRAQSKELLAHAADDGICFEHLGVDYLMIDEAHYFKNLAVPVRTDGFSVAASKRASDLDMKLAWLRSRRDRVATLFTGTPVSNTLLEMYVLQHYLQPDRLAETGLDNADGWAATFVEFSTSVEVAPDGGSFRLHRRPTTFRNIPELLTMFGEVAELRPADSFNIRRPDAVWETRVIDGGEELRAYVAGLAERADKLRQGAHDAEDDNILKICGDGRKAALDLALVEEEADGSPKVDDVVATVAAIHHATSGLPIPGDLPHATPGRLQIIFCDLGTPNPQRGSQVYGKIRRGLIDAGIAPEAIRFIHDAANDAQRTALFADCRAGHVAVLIGSTDKLGVGTNVQTRAIALHHVDAPWRPADVEQREGRVLRPGNRNPAVATYRYVCEGSFDSYMWQTLERKARFIRQLLSGTPGQRQVEDIGAATLDYSQVKALATGNPMLLELAELDTEITRLRTLSTAHTRGRRRLEYDIRSWREQLTATEHRATDHEAIATTITEAGDDLWRDHAGNPIGNDDLPGVLAEAAHPHNSAGAAPITWRGLRITFSTERGSLGESDTLARVRTRMRGIDVDIQPPWLKKGQHWRLLDWLTTRIEGAGEQARQLQAQAADLQARIAEGTSQLDKPFEHADQLAHLDARRTQLDAAIRAEADNEQTKTDDTASPPPPAGRPERPEGTEAATAARPATSAQTPAEPEGLSLARALGLLDRSATIHTPDGRTLCHITSLTETDHGPALLTATKERIPLRDIHNLELHIPPAPAGHHPATPPAPQVNPGSAEPNGTPTSQDPPEDAGDHPSPAPGPKQPAAADHASQPPPPRVPQQQTGSLPAASGSPAKPEREPARPSHLASQDFTPSGSHLPDGGPHPRRRRPARRKRAAPGPGQQSLFDMPEPPPDRPTKRRR